MLTKTVLNLRRGQKYSRCKNPLRISFSPARPSAALSSTSVAHVREQPAPDSPWDVANSSNRFVLRESRQSNSPVPLGTLKDIVHTLDRVVSSSSTEASLPRSITQERQRVRHDPERLQDRQERIEGEQISQAVENYANIFKELVQFGRASGFKSVQRTLLLLYEPFSKALLNEIKLVQLGTIGKDREIYGPYLMLIPPEKLAVITIDTVMKFVMRSGNVGTTVTGVAMSISELVETEFNLWRVKALEASNPELTLTTFQQRLVRYPTRKMRWLNGLNYKLRQITKDAGWSKSDKVKLGCSLIHLLITSTTVASGEPAFEIIKPIRAMRLIALLTMHPTLYETLQHSEDQQYKITPRYLPMLIPPEPWSSDRFYGAYCFHKAPIMKIGMSNQEAAMRKACAPRLLDGLNYLGTIPWVIDHTVFNIAWGAFHRGDQTVAEIPSGIPEPMPSPLAFMRTRAEIQQKRADRVAIYNKLYNLRADNKTQSKKPMRTYTELAIPDVACSVQQDLLATEVLNADKDSAAKEVAANTTVVQQAQGDPNELVLDDFSFRELCNRVKKKNYEINSIRCDLKIRLDIAKQFLNDELFFPHHMDFRGRAYPVPPNLSHLGSDFNRGALRFSKFKPLGPGGIRWLKIHLANLFGYNKVTLDERVRWSEARMADIMDSASLPETGARWWLTAEKPFQALSTCKEIAAAIESGDPANFLSNLPLHQDGSCNGLQHYAALGLDEHGGLAVNLLPSDSPQDVYTRVLEGVLEQLREDAEIPADDAQIARKEKGELARMLAGMVDRKVIKQTVMTSVYGVTLIGARAQIQARLTERFAQDQIKMSYELERQLYSASMYLGRITLNSLSKLFKRAKEIMDWLGMIAAIVAKQNQSMSWVTPLGLPVTQPYRKNARQLVKTVLLTVTLTLEEDYLPVSTRKQRTAFPPNFVHSLDASHMLLTSLRMRDEGLTFAAVHDSYWTHACDMDAMNRHLRDSFVELYEFPLLEDLLESVRVRFPHVSFPPVPTRGNLNLRSVRDSTYFFH